MKEINWNNFVLLQGELFFSQLYIDSLVKKHNFKIKKFFSDTKIEDVKNMVFSRNIMNVYNCFLFYDIKNDFLKEFYELLQRYGILNKKIIFVFDGFIADKRNSFVKQLFNNKRYKEFNYIEASDTNKVKEFLNYCENKLEICLSNDVFDWIIKKFPTTYQKNENKKEIEVCDIYRLFNELNKISSLYKINKQEITLSFIKDILYFERTNDIWNFIKSLLNGDIKLSYEICNKMMQDNTISSIMWLLYSQLNFLIQLKTILQKGIRDVNKIKNILDKNEYINMFYDDNWNIPDTKGVKETNVGRIYKAMESSSNWDITNIFKQHKVVANAIYDIRNGMREDIVLHCVILALAGKMKYDKSFFV